MKASDLAKILGAPDNSRLTAKQQSFRLPTHVAAKINALCDVYPNRTKTEIVGLLLAAALDDAISHLPASLGEECRPGRMARCFITPRELPRTSAGWRTSTLKIWKKNWEMKKLPISTRVIS